MNGAVLPPMEKRYNHNPNHNNRIPWPRSKGPETNYIQEDHHGVVNDEAPWPVAPAVPNVASGS